MSDRKEYHRQYREKNKERIKQYRETHKQQKQTYDKLYREKNRERTKEYHKNYIQTPQGKKIRTINSWKRYGLKLYGYTYEEVYEYYLSINNCEVCNKDITSNKYMDHCHVSGCFRWVLCSSCNTNDYWMKRV